MYNSITLKVLGSMLVTVVFLLSLLWLFSQNQWPFLSEAPADLKMLALFCFAAMYLYWVYHNEDDHVEKKEDKKNKQVY